MRVIASLALLPLLSGCGSGPKPKRPDKPVWCPEKQVARIEANLRTPESFDARVLLGKSPDAARSEAARQGCAFVVVEGPGTPRVLEMNLRVDRIGAVVKGDVVVEVTLG
jgi:hypothetical protein